MFTVLKLCQNNLLINRLFWQNWSCSINNSGFQSFEIVLWIRFFWGHPLTQCHEFNILFRSYSQHENRWCEASNVKYTCICKYLNYYEPDINWDYLHIGLEPINKSKNWTKPNLSKLLIVIKHFVTRIYNICKMLNTRTNF